MDVTWNKEGATLFKKGEYSAAVAYFTKAILTDPVNGVYLVNRSAAFAACGRAQEALQDADNAIRLTPQYPRAYLRKANALILLHRYEEALSAIESGLLLEPNHQELLTARARARTHLQVFDPQGNNNFNSIRSDSNPIQIENQNQQQQQTFNQSNSPPLYPSFSSVNSPPKPSIINNNLNSNQQQQQNSSPSKSPPTEKKVKEQTSEPSLKRFGISSWFGLASSSANAANKRGVELLQKGQPADALIELNTAVENTPSNHQFLCNRASALLELSRIEEAIEDLDKAIELSPSFLLAHIRKSHALLLSNKTNEARSILQKAEHLVTTKKDRELIQNTMQEIERRETYLSFILPPPDEEPPPYPYGIYLFIKEKQYFINYYILHK